MTGTAQTAPNYGVLFDVVSPTGTSYGLYVQNITLPEFMVDEIEITHHESGGWKEFIPSNLVEVGEFSITVLLFSAAMTSAFNTIVAGTIGTYQITVPGLNKWEFDAFIKSVKLEDADATKPDAVKGVITFRPTGVLDENAT